MTTTDDTKNTEPTEAEQLQARIAELEASLKAKEGENAALATQLEETKAQVASEIEAKGQLQTQVEQFVADRKARVESEYDALEEDAKAWVDKFGGEDEAAKLKAIAAYKAIPKPEPAASTATSEEKPKPKPAMPQTRLGNKEKPTQEPPKDRTEAAARLAQGIREKVAANSAA